MICYWGLGGVGQEIGGVIVIRGSMAIGVGFVMRVGFERSSPWVGYSSAWGATNSGSSLSFGQAG